MTPKRCHWAQLHQVGYCAPLKGNPNDASTTLSSAQGEVRQAIPQQDQADQSREPTRSTTRRLATLTTYCSRGSGGRRPAA